MNYNFTLYYKTNEERIEAIREDILREYPRLGDLAVEAAKLEAPFGREHEDFSDFIDYENHINRLIDIIIVTDGKVEFIEEYRKACNDLLRNYDSWRRNYHYAEPEKSAVSLVVRRFNDHINDQSKPLITYAEAWKTIRDENEKNERKQQSLRLKEKYPLVGEEITDEVINIERDKRHWARFQENDIIQLVMILKLIEDKEEYQEAYKAYLEQLKEMYLKWQQTEGKGYLTFEQKAFVEMMDRFNEHLENKEVPIVLYADLIDEKRSELTNGNRSL